MAEHQKKVLPNIKLFSVCVKLRRKVLVCDRDIQCGRGKVGKPTLVFVAIWNLSCRDSSLWKIGGDYFRKLKIEKICKLDFVGR
jgi:hypothetical protein